MAGNVLEWTNDWYSGSYYSSLPLQQSAGTGRRALTGCSGVAVGSTTVRRLRVANRYAADPTVSWLLYRVPVRVSPRKLNFWLSGFCSSAGGLGAVPNITALARRGKFSEMRGLF